MAWGPEVPAFTCGWAIHPSCGLENAPLALIPPHPFSLSPLLPLPQRQQLLQAASAHQLQQLLPKRPAPLAAGGLREQPRPHPSFRCSLRQPRQPSQQRRGERESCRGRGRRRRGESDGSGISCSCRNECRWLRRQRAHPVDQQLAAPHVAVSLLAAGGAGDGV